MNEAEDSWRPFVRRHRVILQDVLEERLRQDDRWGIVDLDLQSHHVRLAILLEEVGEVAKALNEDVPTDDLRTELIQVAAVAIATVEAMDRA